MGDIFTFSINSLRSFIALASVTRSRDDVSIVDVEAGNDAFAAYYAEGASNTEDREPVFSPELGLAIEGLHEGMTVQQLWNVL